jgi:chromosome segregation ATPase
MSEPLPSDLVALAETVAALKDEIRTLQYQNSEKRRQIFTVQCDTLKVQSLRPATITQHAAPSSEPVTINDEHRVVLSEKANQLALARREVGQLLHSNGLLEAKLNDARSEFASCELQILEATSAIQDATARAQQAQLELSYVNGQVKERTSEIKIMQEIKREAEGILSQFVDRAENCDVIDGGRLDMTKAVQNLSNDLNAADAELRGLEAELDASKRDHQAEKTSWQDGQDEHDRAVKWESERKELKEELTQLTKDLHERKSAVQTTETRQFSEQNFLQKVLPLIKKWRGAPGSVDVPPDATVTKLLAEIDRERAERARHVKENQVRVAQLIVANANLEKEVQRSKAALDRVVTLFHSNEARLKKEIEDVRAKATEEEKALLAKIAKAKLHIGQARLQKT